MTTVVDLFAQDRVPILGALRQDVVAFLVQHTSTLRVSSGEIVFVEGSMGESLYIIEEGRIEISQNKEGERRTLANFGPGDCFGEMALIDCQPRSATAIALEPTRLCVITGNTLFELYRFDVEQFAVLQMNISREVIRRLRQAGSRPMPGNKPARAANDGTA